MINIIGTQRLIFIVILVLLNAGGGGLYYMMDQNIIEQEQKLNRLKRQVNARFNEVKKVRDQFETLRGQVSDYVGLEQRGFFEEQERDMLRDVFYEAQKKSQVLRAKYNVSPYKVESSAHITQPNLKWVNSSVTMDVEALDDVDVFSFIELVEQGFPGYVQFKSVKLDRSGALGTESLKDIGNGKPVALVNANVSFTWHSLPEEKEKEPEQAVQ